MLGAFFFEFETGGQDIKTWPLFFFLHETDYPILLFFCGFPFRDRVDFFIE